MEQLASGLNKQKVIEKVRAAPALLACCPAAALLPSGGGGAVLQLHCCQAAAETRLQREPSCPLMISCHAQLRTSSFGVCPPGRV